MTQICVSIYIQPSYTFYHLTDTFIQCDSHRRKHIQATKQKTKVLEQCSTLFKPPMDEKSSRVSTRTSTGFQEETAFVEGRGSKQCVSNCDTACKGWHTLKLQISHLTLKQKIRDQRTFYFRKEHSVRFVSYNVLRQFTVHLILATKRFKYNEDTSYCITLVSTVQANAHTTIH